METKKCSISNGVKTKYLISGIAIIFTFFGIILFSNTVSAQEPKGADNIGIQYPIAELGNCASKAACGEYCDKPKNTEACVNFAEKNNLMSQKEVEAARNFIAAGDKGPGGCTSKDSCESYCNDVNHINECVNFAEKNNLMPPEELAEAKKVQAAVARGVKPPPCGNKKQCDAYCEDPDHMEECINFGAEAGFMQGKELEDAKKMLAAVKKGVKPPPCKGKEACDEYCSTPANMEVCMNFAAEAGFMNEEEKANSQKMLEAVKKGAIPPKCKGKEECDVYCGQEEHFEECVSFSEAAGFMSSEDAAMARKTGGKGPGGCKGKDECEAFCKNPDNQETCFNFAKENGMISEEDLKNMEEGKQGMQKALEQAPLAVIDCLSSELGASAVEKLKTGEGVPSKEIGDKMKICFEKAGPPQGEQREGNMMPSGPGGCKGPEECKAYCETHQEECQNFKPGPDQGGGPNNGQGMGQGQLNQQNQQGQPGPGGCTNPEECKAYCETHQEECQRFQPGPGAVNPGGQTMPPQSGPGGCKTPEECKTYCTANPEACQNLPPGVPPQGQQPPLPLPSGYQSQPQPQGQYSSPLPGQNQLPPCSGEACQSGPLPGQPLNQPMEGNTFTPPPPPLNSPGYYEQPPAYTQPPAGQPPVYTQPPINQEQPPQPIEQQQQQPLESSPLNPPPPISFNPSHLQAAISEIFSLFVRFLK